MKWDKKIFIDRQPRTVNRYMRASRELDELEGFLFNPIHNGFKSGTELYGWLWKKCLL
jgi:hypothetical protein